MEEEKRLAVLIAEEYDRENRKPMVTREDTSLMPRRNPPRRKRMKGIRSVPGSEQKKENSATAHGACVDITQESYPPNGNRNAVYDSIDRAIEKWAEEEGYTVRRTK